MTGGKNVKCMNFLLAESLKFRNGYEKKKNKAKIQEREGAL